MSPVPQPSRRRRVLAAASVAVMVAAAGREVGWAAPTPSQAVRPTPQGRPPDDPSRGLHYGDLRRTGPTEKCRGQFEFRLESGETGCTHGPDPAPAGVDVRAPGPLSPAAVEPTVALATLPCQGDGVSGPRVQLIYAHADGVADRYATLLPSFRLWAAQVDDVINLSAAETGGSRRVRYVHDGACVPTVPNVTLSAAGDDSFGNTISELRSLGYNRADRKYLVWVDSNVYCGIAQVYTDDRPGQDNPNNGRAEVPGMVARVDAGCWGNSNALVEVHELVHTLGSVQPGAPHASPGLHCTDDYDRMCYADGAGVVLQILCAVSGHENRLDCNHDDYFSTSPVPGSWLATHWNTANSAFLAGGGTSPPTTTTSTTTSTTRPPPTTTTTTTTTTVAPNTQMARFVDSAYRDVLGRLPSATEKSSWLGLLTTGYSRTAMAGSLTTSIEYRQLVVHAYSWTFLGRLATASELDALVNAVAAGWLFEWVETLVLGGNEFYARQGSTAGGYVDGLYRLVLGLTPDAAGRAFWVDQLTNKGLDRYSVALAFVTSGVARHRVVAGAFSWFLDRAASSTELTSWVDQLAAGVRQETLSSTLVGSAEYLSKV